MTPELLRVYRDERLPVTGTSLPYGRPYLGQATAAAALREARRELALRSAESAGLIRFRWEYDGDYEPGTSGDPDDEKAELKHFKDGSWEVLGCIAEVPKCCPHCRQPLDDEWVVVDSLWGIVIDVDDENGSKRSIERDLVEDAHVLDMGGLR